MADADGTVEHRRALVEVLRASGVLSDRVAAAFEAVPREAFVADFAATHGFAEVYRDVPIVVKRDERDAPIASSSQPAVMATMLELLQVAEGHRVLEVGTGTGYNAALLDVLAGPTGSVVTVDVDEDLAELAERALDAVEARGDVVVGDGRLGWPRGAPYDRIIVTASSQGVPVAWRDQLSEGGLLVLPLRLTTVFNAQVVASLRRVGGRLESEAVVRGAFMGLRDAGGQAPRVSNLWEDDVAPRTHPVGTFSWDLSVFVCIAASTENLVETAIPRAEGHAAPAFGVRLEDSASFLVRVGGTTELWSYGSSAAETEMRELMDEWVDLGSPPVERLHLVVGYDDPPATAWRMHKQTEGWVAFDWR